MQNANRSQSDSWQVFASASAGMSPVITSAGHATAEGPESSENNLKQNEREREGERERGEKEGR